MDSDDILKRISQTIGVFGGGYLFLYLVIVETQRPPIGYALKFVQIFEAVAKWLFVIAVIIAVLFFMLAIIGHVKSKKQLEREQQESIKQKEEWERQKSIREAEEAKQKELKLEQEKLARELRQQELEQRQIKKETYLKNRSTEDATKDALQDFM